MYLTFTSGGTDELCCQKRRMGTLSAGELVGLAPRMDRAHDSWIHLLVAGGPGDSRLYAVEQTDGMLGRPRLRPAARQDGAHARQDGSLRSTRLGRTVERQPRLRRVPQRDDAAAGRRAVRIP